MHVENVGKEIQVTPTLFDVLRRDEKDLKNEMLAFIYSFTACLQRIKTKEKIN
jgi:hypothetical protein